jgi:hypothetical protein
MTLDELRGAKPIPESLDAEHSKTPRLCANWRNVFGQSENTSKMLKWAVSSYPLGEIITKHPYCHANSRPFQGNDKRPKILSFFMGLIRCWNVNLKPKLENQFMSIKIKPNSRITTAIELPMEEWSLLMNDLEADEHLGLIFLLRYGI